MIQKRPITIEDIAQEANVSKSTVSRVLNGSTPVALAKREAVQAAIAALDYQPNMFAKGLASGQSMTVGVLTQNVSSPIFDAMLRGVMQGLNGSRYSPIFADGYWDAEKEVKAVETLLGRLVDGLIVLGGQAPADFLQNLNLQLPLVVVGRDVTGFSGYSLTIDDFKGAYKATEYLLSLGHKRIAHVTGMLSHHDAVARRKGYLQALIDGGIEPDPALIVEGDYSEASGVEAIEALITNGNSFTAVFAGNDQMALGIRLAFFRRGIRVPDDVSIVGYDDQASSAFMTPPLTTIRQPAIALGQASANAMLQLLKGEKGPPHSFEVELIVRDSAASPR